jgi:hypothetical protein
LGEHLRDEGVVEVQEVAYARAHNGNRSRIRMTSKRTTDGPDRGRRDDTLAFPGEEQTIGTVLASTAAKGDCPSWRKAGVGGAGAPTHVTQ